MKNIYVVVCFLISAIFTANAQVYSVGDTIQDYLIPFETSVSDVQVGDSANTIWQLGQPSNILFDSAYSAPYAMVTDTLGFYPVNNYSYFDLFITDNNFPYFFEQVQLEFMHKFDTDSLKDGGYITISYDEGQTWINVIEDNTFNYDNTPANDWGFINYEEPNLYSLEDTLFNGEKGFSGNSDGWVKTRLSWYRVPVKSVNDYWESDTLFIRFNFISDDIDNNKEGWMIDNIRMYQVDLGSKVKVIKPSIFSIHPQPANDYIIIQKESNNKERLEISDLQGRLIKEVIIFDSPQKIDISYLKQGTYILSIGEQREKLIVR